MTGVGPIPYALELEDLEYVRHGDRPLLARLFKSRGTGLFPLIANGSLAGQRIADRVAEFGGSWSFILTFRAALVVWIVVDSAAILRPPSTPIRTSCSTWSFTAWPPSRPRSS